MHNKRRLLAIPGVILAGLVTVPSVAHAAQLPCAAPAPSSVPYRCETWATTTPAGPNLPLGFNQVEPTAVAVSPLGDRVFQTTPYYGTYNTYRTVARDTASGAVLWSNDFASPNGGDAMSAALTVSPDGSTVYVTGIDNFSGQHSELGTIALRASDGTQLWANSLSVGTYASGASIAVSADGHRVYTAGTSFTDDKNTNYGFLTVAYDSTTGTRLWQGRYIGSAHSSDGAAALAVDPATDRLFVTGHSLGSGAGDEYAVIAYAGATGTQLWSARWSPNANASSYPKAITVSPDGLSVAVTGYTNDGNGGTSTRYATVVWDATNGTQRWVGEYHGSVTGFAHGNAIAVTPDSATLVVTGAVSGPLNTPFVSTNEDYQFGTVAYDLSSGAQRWTATYGVDSAYVTGFVTQQGTGVVAAPDGSAMYVTGPAFNTGANYASAVIALDPATGAQQWFARYLPTTDPAASALPTALVVNPKNGQILVGAVVEHAAGNPAAENTILAYDAVVPSAGVPEVPAAALLVVAAAGVVATRSRLRRYTVPQRHC